MSSRWRNKNFTNPYKNLLYSIFLRNTSFIACVCKISFFMPLVYIHSRTKWSLEDIKMVKSLFCKAVKSKSRKRMHLSATYRIYETFVSYVTYILCILYFSLHVSVYVQKLNHKFDKLYANVLVVFLLKWQILKEVEFVSFFFHAIVTKFAFVWCERMRTWA